MTTMADRPTPGDVPSPLPADIENRLYNFKFDQAADMLAPTHVGPRADLIRTLGGRYGNVGWFYGDDADFLGSVLRVLGVTFDGYEPRPAARERARQVLLGADVPMSTRRADEIIDALDAQGVFRP